MFAKLTRGLAVVPAAAAVTVLGGMAMAPHAGAAMAPSPTAYPGDPGYASDQSAYEQGYEQGMRQADARPAAQPAGNQYAPTSDYAPSAATTGPNDAGAPRTSEAQTSQNEACGTNPGENNHTLGLPKLVNLNFC
jgi:hypothetical protein